MTRSILFVKKKLQISEMNYLVLKAKLKQEKRCEICFDPFAKRENLKFEKIQFGLY